MPQIRIGCQTYTWEMMGDHWRGTADDILDAVAGAGYEGVEFAAPMLGDYYGDPHAFEAALAQRGLQLAALAYASQRGFSDPANRDGEIAEATGALRFVAHFPHPMLCLGGAASPSRADHDAKLAYACRFYSEVAQMGAAVGVVVCVHPHSHYGSLFESAEEYARLLEATADSGLGLNPDSGHIVRSRQDLVTCFVDHIERIRHVHVKDVTADGRWAPLGDGVCDFAGLVALLQVAEYDGWVVAEEESDLAWADPAEAVAVNRRYLHGVGL